MNTHAETVSQIQSILTTWGASEVNVTDNSHLHAGHEGAKSGGGHFAVVIKSESFNGLSRVKSHRLVYQQLHALFADGSIHALEVDAVVECMKQKIIE